MKYLRIIPSKSDAHRALICAALSEEPVQVLCEETSKDIEATKACLKALTEDTENPEDMVDLYCGESGSTLRFLLPVAAALGKKAAFHPEGRLSERPLSPLYEELTAHGVTMSPQGSVPFVVEGKLTPGTFTIPGNVSSQFISGLLFALPLLEEGSIIQVTGDLESSGYVDMTIGTLVRFGIQIGRRKTKEGQEFIVPGKQKYQSKGDYTVEGDWSNAAFWLAAGILGEEAIRVEGLNPDSRQGDQKVVDILRKFGAHLETEVQYYDDNTAELIVVAYPSRNKLKATTVDVKETPDLAPILSLVAAVAKGNSKFIHTERLRIKESDRVQAILDLINNLGGKAEEFPAGYKIKGVPVLTGGHVDGVNDHRIVMTAAVAGIVSTGTVEITDSGAIAKSYPSFFDVWKEAELGENLVLL